MTSIKVEMEEMSPVQRKLVVAVASQEVANKIERAYKTWGKKAKVKGFRPGKAPRGILENYFGKQIEDEVSQELMRDTLNQAIEEVKLHPVMVRFPEKNPPVIAGDDFTYQVEVEVPPDFIAKDYVGIELDDTPINVTDDMVEMRLADIRENNATLQPVTDRNVQAGDFAIFDYEIWWNEEPLPEGKAENQAVEIGNGKFNPQVEEWLVGKAPGFEGELRVELPQDDKNPLLAGKTVDYRVKVKEIKVKELPVLDDEFARSLGGQFEDLAALREAIRENIVKGQEAQRRAGQREQVYDQLIAKNDFEVPPSLVTQEQERLLREQLYNFERRGLNVMGLDPQKLMAAMAPMAERRVRVQLLLGQIGDQEEIKVEDADIDNGFQRLADQFNDTVDNVKKFYREKDMMIDFIQHLREDKTMEFIMGKAVLVAPAAPEAKEA